MLTPNWQAKEAVDPLHALELWQVLQAHVLPRMSPVHQGRVTFWEPLQDDLVWMSSPAQYYTHELKPLKVEWRAFKIAQGQTTSALLLEI